MTKLTTSPATRRWHVVRLLPALLVLSVPLLLLALVLSRAPAALSPQPWLVAIDWLPELGLHFDLQMDALSLLFALLVTGIGCLVVFYSLAYMKGESGQGRYYGVLLTFMVAMLGVVTAGNLLLLFVCWELTSVSSYLLIGFRHEDEASQRSALQALLVTSLGGLALLAGILLLGQVYGTLELHSILSRPTLLRAHPYYGWVLALVLLGACTKSAQFPFHFWLPNAMVAPTPVSAYLHSATMVKAGLYLLARLAPVLGGDTAWEGALLSIGGITMLVGAGQALRQRDLKAILAYTTISSLGTFVALLGCGGSTAVQAALVLLIAHALYKGALFLAVGAIDHATGTRDVLLLSGMRSHLPGLAIATVLAAATMAGLPPTTGYLAKELSYEAAFTLGGGSWANAVPILVLFAAYASNGALAIVIGYRLFFGAVGEPSPQKPHGVPWLMLAPVAILGIGSWLPGLLPRLADSVVSKAAALISPDAHPHALVLWHGWGWPLGLSAVTIAAGIGLYGLWPRLLRSERGHLRLPTPTAAYEWLMHRALPTLASHLSGALHHGSLRDYLLVIMATAVGLVGWGVWASRLLSLDVLARAEYHWAELATVVLLIVAALGTVLARTRLAAITALGATGALVTLFYVRFHAPDLALTQLLIEALTVILLLLVFHYLPGELHERARHRRGLEAIVAVASGLLVAALVLVANDILLGPSVAEYYRAHSLPDAHGHNVVNVILVDFRGFDTLGEITVLATAALGVYALLRVRRQRR